MKNEHLPWVLVDDTWMLNKGDKLTVKGWRGPYRFVSQVRNNANGETWINVIRDDRRGGIRSVTADRITKKRKVRT